MNDGQCVWQRDADGNDDTGCGGIWCLDEGTPPDNGMKFCPYCGKAIEWRDFCDHKWKLIRGWIGDANVINGTQTLVYFECQACGHTQDETPDGWEDPRESDGDYLRDKAIDDRLTGDA